MVVCDPCKPNNGKVVLITNESNISRYLATRIAGKLSLFHVVVVRSSRPARTKLSAKNRISVLMKAVIGENILNKLKVIKRFFRAEGVWEHLKTLEETQEHSALSEYFSEFRDVSDFPSPWSTVEDVNASSALELLQRIKPDIILLFGTSIIKLPVIRSARIGVLNMHTSILPHYRGSRVEFWQLYNGDYDTCGITVHFVDEGVDTGDIIMQVRTPVDDTDNFYSLRYKNISAAIKIMPHVINSVLDGTANRTRQPVSHEPAYTYSQVTLEKRIEFQKKRGFWREAG